MKKLLLILIVASMSSCTFDDMEAKEVDQRINNIDGKEVKS